MDKNKKIEIALPLCFILFAIYVIVTGLRLPGVEGYFPIMIGVAMMLSSISILVSALRKAKSVIAIEKINLSNIVKASLALLVYVLLLPMIGYFASTVLLGIFIIHALGYREWSSMILYPFIIVTILFFGFKVLLRVPLPVSFLGFL